MKTLVTALRGLGAIGGRRTRLAAVLLALGVVAVVQAPPASAGEAGRSGTVGVYTINNHPSSGSFASCLYQPFSSSQHPSGRRLERIEVRPPIMKAVDRSGMEDRQDVTFVATLTRVDSFGTHTQVEKTPLQQRPATDRNPASFAPVIFNLSGRAEGRYAIVIDMSWRRPSNANLSEGNVSFIFDYYDQHRLVSGGSSVREWYQAGGCLKTFTW